MLSRAISFLWVDYQRDIWYWEVVGARPIIFSICLSIHLYLYISISKQLCYTVLSRVRFRFCGSITSETSGTGKWSVRGLYPYLSIYLSFSVYRHLYR